MERTVTVTGRGTGTAVPDAAVVRVAAGHRDASVEGAFAGVASAVAALTAEAEDLVDAARVASRDVGVWPAHDDHGRTVGFECRHVVEVRCPSLDVASRLLSALVSVVGDRLQVEGVSLEVTDSAAAEATAVEAAYDDAVRRAGALAGLAGLRLGQVLRVVEGAGDWAPYPRSELAAATRDMALVPGERQIGAAVTVTFALD